MFKIKYLIFLFLGITLAMACKQDDDQPMDDIIEIDGTPYEL